jgi:hypothetical protein
MKARNSYYEHLDVTNAGELNTGDSKDDLGPGGYIS